MGEEAITLRRDAFVLTPKALALTARSRMCNPRKTWVSSTKSETTELPSGYSGRAGLLGGHFRILNLSWRVSEDRTGKPRKKISIGCNDGRGVYWS
jgi:hypothetical protein